jgi:hypothetical protein
MMKQVPPKIEERVVENQPVSLIDFDTDAVRENLFFIHLSILFL